MRRQRRISAIQAISSLPEQNREFCSEYEGLVLPPVPQFPSSPFPRSPVPQIKAQRSGFDLDKELQSEGRKKRPQGSLGDMSFDSDVWRHSQVVRHGTANP